MVSCSHGGLVVTQAEEYSVQAQQCGQGRALQQSTGVEDIIGEHVCLSPP